MATFRLERSTDANGVSERIVDDHGVIALVKARGKAVGASNLLAAAPDLLAALREVNLLLGDIGRGERICTAIMNARRAIAKAEGR